MSPLAAVMTAWLGRVYKMGLLLVNMSKYVCCYVCVYVRAYVCMYIRMYTGCPRRNVQYFGRVFLMLNYTDITQNTYIQS